MKNINILVIDDDIKLLELLHDFLSNSGYHVHLAENGKQGLLACDLFIFDLIICDWMMPELNGIEFVNALRKKNSTPVLMLTALSELDNKIEAYDCGIDDFLSKPFEPVELLLKIKSILKRTDKKSIKKEIKFGDFTFNLNELVLKENDTEIKLTDVEQKILKILTLKYNEPVSRETLASEANYEERGIDVIITRLRKKIGINHLITIRNIGYQLKG